jgi:hypothetical protein
LGGPGQLTQHIINQQHREPGCDDVVLRGGGAPCCSSLGLSDDFTKVIETEVREAGKWTDIHNSTTVTYMFRKVVQHLVIRGHGRRETPSKKVLDILSPNKDLQCDGMS